MSDYKKLTLKNRDFVVTGNNKKMNPFKNHFNQAQLAILVQEATLPIVAANNTVSFTGITGTTNVVNVLANDTLGGAPATTTNINLTTVTPNANLVLNPNGSVNIVNPTPAGTYALTYRICQKDVPTNCAQATVTVTVVAPV